MGEMVTKQDNHKFVDQRPCSMVFHNNEGQVGELTWANGTFRFIGEADEAAKAFFDALSNLLI